MAPKKGSKINHAELPRTPEGTKCECGCGCNVPVNRYKIVKYIVGHNRRGQCGYSLSEEAVKKMTLFQKSRRVHGPHSEETKKKIREKRALQIFGPMSEEQKIKIGNANKGKTRSEEHRQKLSENATRRWASGGFKNRYIASSAMEHKLAPVVKALGFEDTLRNNYRISGTDRSRIPDFYNPETKEIIEIFGLWWHKNRPLPDGKQHETPEAMIEWYKNLGWNCTVVWENEFKAFYDEKVKLASAVCPLGKWEAVEAAS